MLLETFSSDDACLKLHARFMMSPRIEESIQDPETLCNLTYRALGLEEEAFVLCFFACLSS